MHKVIIDFDGTLTAEETQVSSLAARSLDTLAYEILGTPRPRLAADYAATRARLLANPHRYAWEVNGLTISYCDEGAFILNTSTLQVMLCENPEYTRAVAVAFDQQGVSERAPLSRGTREALVRSVSEVRPGGGTPLLEAIGLGYRQLTLQGQSQLGYGEYHLVVVTDGLASQGQEPGPLVHHMLDRSPVVLHTIGFCIGQDHSLNQPGRVLYRAADDYAGLRAGLQGVLAESSEFVPTRFE